MTIAEAQELRKTGKWIVVNKSFTKLIRVSSTKPRTKRNEKAFGPLTKKTVVHGPRWLAFPAAHGRGIPDKAIRVI